MTQLPPSPMTDDTPPERRTRLHWVEALVILVIALILAGIMYPVKSQRVHGPSCTSNLKQLGLALLMYGQDYGTFPPHADWTGRLMPHHKNRHICRCPGEGKAPVGYAYAPYLAGHSESSIPTPERLFAFWDAEPGTEEACFRHHGCLNIAYVDGHVRWASPEDVFAELVERSGGEVAPPPNEEP